MTTIVVSVGSLSCCESSPSAYVGGARVSAVGHVRTHLRIILAHDQLNARLLHDVHGGVGAERVVQGHDHHRLGDAAECCREPLRLIAGIDAHIRIGAYRHTHMMCVRAHLAALLHV